MNPAPHSNPDGIETGLFGVSNNSKLLGDAGYWPAVAMNLIAEEKYAGAVQVCRQHLRDPHISISGRVAYGLALYSAGQFEAAEEQFREILVHDPDHLLALKYLGNIAYISGDEWTALANYRRILEIDPECGGLFSRIPKKGPRETTRTISLVRSLGETSGAEGRTHRKGLPEPMRRGSILVSETVGDLYLSQGHARQAAEVYQKLYDQQPSPSLADKLAQALEKLSEREPIHVAETDD